MLRTVKDWLPDWAAALEGNSFLLWAPDLLDRETHSAEAAAELVNARISALTAWLNTLRPHYRVVFFCEGEGTCNAVCTRVDEDGCCATCGAEPVRVER